MAIVRLEGLGQLKKSTTLGLEPRDLPACSIAPQPTTLPRAPGSNRRENLLIYLLMLSRALIFCGVSHEDDEA
jgi:hypothetical protein